MTSVNHPLAPNANSDGDFEHEFSNPDKAPKPQCSPSSTSHNCSDLSRSSQTKNKYLFPATDIIEPLRPEQVRWFYKEDKKWIPFIGYDSMRIECKYREAKSSEQQALLGAYKNSDREEKICVRGNLYEASVNDMECYPIYWDSQELTVEIMRGTWFMDSTWMPLEEHVSTQIEHEHLVKFQNQTIEETPKLENGKGPMPVLHSLKFDEFYLEWNENSFVSLHYEKTTSRLYRAVGNKLGLTNNGTRIYRGYCYEARIDDKLADIGHLVFVIHGIGQAMDTGNIVARCAEFRKTCLTAIEKYLPEIDSEGHKRAEFLPVEWRSSLKLDGDVVESITPAKMQRIRSIVNSSAMDVMYYTSPLYRSEITQGLHKQLNRLYDMFCQRTPYFEASNGKVSIVAHSLGAVIINDIITGWNPIHLYDQYVSTVIEATHEELGETGSNLVEELDQARKRVNELEEKLFSMAEKQHAKSPSLKFKVTNLFSVGSPLAVFLAMRGIRPVGTGTQDHILPRDLCSRLFNIYHPYDPVAYRLEPLIIRAYETIAPIKIFRHNNPNKVPYDTIPPVAYNKRPANKENFSMVDTKEEEQNNNTEILISKTPERRKSESPEKEAKKSAGWGFFWRKDKTKVVSEMGAMDSCDCSPPSTRSSSPASSHIAFANAMSQQLGDERAFSDFESDFVSAVDIPEVKLFTEGMCKQDKNDYDIFEKPDHTELEHRLDYQIPEGKMENAYISALTSHTSYWTNQDVALFILQQLFPDIAPT